MGETMSFEVFLSALEIVDERIVDLAREGGGAGAGGYRIVADPTYGTQVEGLTTTPVHTASHVRSLIGSAQANRAPSSSSHLVLTLTVRSSDSESGHSSVGKLTLVDLAPAETSGAKGASGPTNDSLGALHAVIEAASSKKKVDFGGALLTRLLQDSLGGNSKTMMFVCCSPDEEKTSISATTLSFGVKARDVKLGQATKVKESKQTGMIKANTTMSALAEHASNSGGAAN